MKFNISFWLIKKQLESSQEDPREDILIQFENYILNKIRKLRTCYDIFIYTFKAVIKFSGRHLCPDD